MLSSIATARGALARGDVLGKVNACPGAPCASLKKASITALDRVDGGELAQNLGDLEHQHPHAPVLIMANARNDDAMMQEVMRLIEPVALGWNESSTCPAEALWPPAVVPMEA